MALDNGRIDLWSAFVQAHAAVTAALESELERERELPLSWYEVLAALGPASAGQMRMQDLAREVRLSKSGLTRLFDRMEDAGLVERRSCADDRRGTYAALTPAGRRALRRAMPVHQRGVEAHFGRQITSEEARAMRSAFGRILRGPGRG